MCCRALLLAVCSLTTGVAFAEQPAKPAKGSVSLNTTGQGAFEPGKAMLEQFRSLETLSFAAQVEVTALVGATDVECVCVEGVALGELRYWAAGDRYRIVSMIEGDCCSWARTDVAFDGRVFELLRADGTLIRAERDDPRTALPVLPNPMLALVQFRYPLTDRNERFRLRFKDLQSDQTPETFWRVTWQRVHLRPEGPSMRAIFPGGTYLGTAYQHYVYTAPDDRRKILRIDRVAPGGRLLSSTRFSAYVDIVGQDGRKTLWPTHVTMIGYNPSGVEAVRIDYFVYDIRVDKPLDPSVFAVDHTRAERIWNDNLQDFEIVRPKKQVR